MDELEKAAYEFMNQPRNDEERLEGMLQCDIIQAIEDGFNGHDVRRDVILKDVNWLIEMVLKQHQEIERLKFDGERGYDILASVRDTLLPLVSPIGNACGDMTTCTVSNPECIKCLAEQIKDQFED
jgi:hypothetical protein